MWSPGQCFVATSAQYVSVGVQIERNVHQYARSQETEVGLLQEG